jgi:hypothetical protein
MSNTVVVGQIPGGMLPYYAIVTDTATGEQATAPIVFPGNPADGTFAGDPSTTAFINTYFNTLHNFTGATVGDLIVEVVQYDVSTSPATVVSTVWLNATLGTTLAGPPLATNLTYMGGAGLTDAQLRATPVLVESGQLPATLGQKARAASMSVGLSTEDAANLADAGSFAVQTATALQAMELQLPTALGTAAAADSLTATLCTEDKATLTSILNALLAIQANTDRIP